LDVGTSRLVVARQTGGDIRYESQLNAFVSLPHSKMTENVLRREHIPHTIQQGQIMVQGNESEKFADLLDVETRRTMTKGFLDPREPGSLQVIRELLINLLGYRDPFRERKVVFTVPAPPLGAEDSLTFHEKTLKQMIGDLGYESKCINEGLAVIYGELERLELHRHRHQLWRWCNGLPGLSFGPRAQLQRALRPAILSISKPRKFPASAPIASALPRKPRST
jgi:hypothetical protein